MPLQNLAVIGAGTMGAGICESAAVAGLAVVSIEHFEAQRERARQRLAASVQKGIDRGKLDVASADVVLDRIAWESDLNAAADADFVIEAVTENQVLKCEIFEQLGGICHPDRVLASNTSSISITRLGAASGRPEKVIGMHFFNPVPVMPPVEIVRGLSTSDETVTATEALAKQMGKTPLVVRDVPGFAVNRILMPLLNEACFALEEQVATPEAIDQLMKLGCNHPMGPLELADFIGLDVVLAILEVLHTQFGDPKFRPATLLRRKVEAGHLGRKSGRGFYEYQ